MHSGQVSLYGPRDQVLAKLAGAAQSIGGNGARPAGTGNGVQPEPAPLA
jgi:hypothetical protein